MTLIRLSAAFLLLPLAFAHWPWAALSGVAALAFFVSSVRSIRAEIKAFEEAFPQPDTDQKQP